VLGRTEGIKGHHDIRRHPDARLIPGLVLFRWDAPLLFANAELLHDPVLAAVATSPTPVRWAVVAADMLVESDGTLHAAGIELCFAEMKGPVKDKLKRFALFARLGEETFFPTLGVAVNSYLKTYTVDWDDWEERTP
jgi:MFS superfamily sulfate permease-like transporter